MPDNRRLTSIRTNTMPAPFTRLGGPEDKLDYLCILVAEIYPEEHAPTCLLGKAKSALTRPRSLILSYKPGC